MELIGLYLIAAGAARRRRSGQGGAARRHGPRHGHAAAGVAAAAPACACVVRAGALAEAALGAVALAFPRPATGALVALSYLCFFGVVGLVARRRGGPLATCGCFGRPDTPPTVLHLVLDLVLAAAAVDRRRSARRSRRHAGDHSWRTSPGPASRSSS